MKRRNGQATTEMIFLMPILVMILAGAMFIVYTSWQGLKVQQAANLAARVQGQERVAGGMTNNDIEKDNGTGLGQGDPDPTDDSSDPSKKYAGQANKTMSSDSVYGKLFKLVKDMFQGSQDQVFVPPPLIGQNVDQVKVIRLINLPNLPFMKWAKGNQQITLEGTAWGGEDTYMYALPRWGRAAGNSFGTGNSGGAEWKNIITESAKSNNHDN